MSEVLDADSASGLVRVQAGITLNALGRQLAGRGLALEDQGDIDAQTLAGALATATHGTGARFGNLSSRVEAMRVVTGTGEQWRSRRIPTRRGCARHAWASAPPASSPR